MACYCCSQTHARSITITRNRKTCCKKFPSIPGWSRTSSCSSLGLNSAGDKHGPGPVSAGANCLCCQIPLISVHATPHFCAPPPFDAASPVSSLTLQYQTNNRRNKTSWNNQDGNRWHIIAWWRKPGSQFLPVLGELRLRGGGGGGRKCRCICFDQIWPRGSI